MSHPFTVDTECDIDQIHDIRSHHRNLIDNYGIDFCEKFLIFLRGFDIFWCYMWLPSEERVNRHSVDIECCHSCWREYDDFFLRMQAEILEKRRLPGSGTPREKNISRCRIKEGESLLECRIEVE